jgi:hypothetical protein
MSDIRVLFDGDTYISGPAECPTHLPDMAYFANAPEDTKLQRGYLTPVYAQVADGKYIKTSHWERVGETAVQVIDELGDHAADAAAQSTQAAIDAGERLRGLAVQWGGMIAGLRAQLMVVGHTIPCDAGAVAADLLTRSLRQELSRAQMDAKGDIADIYGILTAQGLTNQDIADIWALVVAGQNEGI